MALAAKPSRCLGEGQEGQECNNTRILGGQGSYTGSLYGICYMVDIQGSYECLNCIYYMVYIIWSRLCGGPGTHEDPNMA